MDSNFKTVPLEESFEKCSQIIRSNAGKLNTEILLYLYGRYKQAHNGPCLDPQPSIFYYNERQKWSAWKGLGKEFSREQAMREYVDKVEQLILDGIISGQIREGDLNWSFGSKFSRPQIDTDNEENDFDELTKNLFRTVKNPNNNEFTQLSVGEGNSVKLTNQHLRIKDASGMTLLHWACDSGNQSAIRTLISHAHWADRLLAAQDKEGLRPLDNAVICSQWDVVRSLLEVVELPVSESFISGDSFDGVVVPDDLCSAFSNFF